MRDELTFLIRSWFNGGSALPVVQRQLEEGDTERAAATARLALTMPDCQDREELEAILRDCANESQEWQEALEQFAREPSEARWDELLKFVPDEVLFDRSRNMMRALIDRGCNGDILFRCASKIGMTPPLFDLARGGTVDPAVIEERAVGSPAAAAWLSLAALAAFARGDRFGTLRYLRAACSGDDAVLAWAGISEIREAADDELNAELDKLGVPRL